MLPYWPDVEGAPQNTIIGGATLWVLRARPRADYGFVKCRPARRILSHAAKFQY